MKKAGNVRCKRCHRVLTDPEAQQRGYGNVCWQTHLSEEHKKHNLFTVDISKNIKK